MVEVFGTEYSVAEIGEQFAWLGAALRSSPYDLGIACCIPYISNIRTDFTSRPLFGSHSRHAILCNIDFTKAEIDQHLESSNGQCWHSMFRNPVIVAGYPIPRRSEPNTGLEIPLDIMAALVRTRRANVFSGKLFIKGFSAMLIPTRRSGDMLIWHYLYNKDGKYLSYQNTIVPHAESVSFFHLRKPRHFVGWCSDAKLTAGKGYERTAERMFAELGYIYRSSRCHI